MEEGKEIGRLQNAKVIKAVALTSDAKTLAVSCFESKSTPEVKLWDVAEQKELDGLKNFPRRVLSVCFLAERQISCRRQRGLLRFQGIGRDAALFHAVAVVCSTNWQIGEAIRLLLSAPESAKISGRGTGMASRRQTYSIARFAEMTKRKI